MAAAGARATGWQRSGVWRVTLAATLQHSWDARLYTATRYFFLLATAVASETEK